MSGCFPGAGGGSPTPPAPEVSPEPAPEPTPAPPPGPAPAPVADLFGFDISLPPLFKDKPNAAFRKSQLAALARELAAQLEFDGGRAEPIALTTTDALTKFQLMNEYAFRGEVMAPPGFVAAVKAVTVSKLEAGGEGHALAEVDGDTTYRAIAVNIFKAIAQVLETK